MINQKTFTTHGVNFTGESGDQWTGDCPFCSKEGKFYVNVNNGLWDCKTCGLNGNISEFLNQTSLIYKKRLKKKLLIKLAKDRGLPSKAFKGLDIGWNGKSFTFPVRDAKGKVADIRMFKTGSKFIRSTPGCKTGLLGLDKIGENVEEPIIVCEGEWDKVALDFLLKKVGKPGKVVAVPGAQVFKQHWVPYFDDRIVYAMYDNDNPGENGELVLEKRLTGTASELWYLHWIEKLPSGFDVRDYVIRARRDKKFKKYYKSIMSMLRSSPRKETSKDTTYLNEKGKKVITKKVKPISLKKVFKAFNKWLYLPNTDAIEVTLAVMASNKMEGDPLWMFLVSPPGSCKTETLSSLSKCKNDVYATSSLTPHSLISGASWVEGSDPSLIPRLNGKVLVIKDFTTIMQKREQERDEIFGILRDAYDGKCSKVFGTGITRSYSSSFSVLAAVTPRIYEVAESHQSLGERFLKFTMADNMKHYSEEEIINKAISNVNKENKMKDELANAVYAFMQNKYLGFVPDMPDEVKAKIIALARFGARMRGTVSKEKHRQDIVKSRPSAEVGTRIAKQLTKLAYSLAMIRNKKSVGDRQYKLVKKTMLDTIPQRSEDIVRLLFKKCKTIDDTLTTKEISHGTKYPLATVFRILSDMVMLEIVLQVGPAGKHQYTLSPYIRKHLKTAELYTTSEELNRTSMMRKRLKMKKKRKRKKLVIV